ncbi:MAG: trypsin-like peptidase domain-containing protein, partial [Zavarzinella sp.]|nr:trypsin-like peptidase domain-containing protein [Zavarzinella sp.]
MNRLPISVSPLVALFVCLPLVAPTPATAQAPLPIGFVWSHFLPAGAQPAPSTGAAPAVPATTKDRVTYRDVVKRVLPAVVSIEPEAARHAAHAAARPFPDEGPADPLRRFGFPNVNPDESADEPGKPVPLGTGSGFVVDPSGVVVTNYHVVRGADQVEIRLKDGRKFVAKDIKVDPNTDIAIVRFQAKDLPHLQWGDSADMEIG